MKERAIAYTFSVADPDETGAALTSGEAFTVVPFGATLHYVCVAPREDDSGATLDIQDDGVDIVTGISAADHDAPGEWATPEYGGAQTPVAIAAGSEISLDINAAAAANRFDVVMIFHMGETVG